MPFVSDTGIGLSQENIQSLFHPFSQIENSTLLNPDGIGLGLYISRRLCQAMGGDISVESDLGLGSTFTIRLPIFTRRPGDRQSSMAHDAQLMHKPTVPLVIL
ncbi:MAG: hypothetical protein GXP08_04275 [Gammaproteobacteria bacterium]|nr:hypothetical protein [Gammaproteobacteria bacterium]